MPSDDTEAALGLLGLTAAFTHRPPPPPPPPAPSTSTSSTVPAKRKQPPSSNQDDSSANTDTINCICGLSYDDGFSIACDSCARWCHAACFQIDESQVPDEWLCWRCDPRPVDKDRAVKIQRARQRAAAATANSTKRRATSPGVDRKSRKPSGTSGEAGHGHTSNKRKRRASITAAAHALQNHHNQHPEDEHVDIDEPWQHSYVAITKDIVKSDDARDRLRRVATDWRGVTAISPSPLTPGCSAPALLTPDAIPSHPPITLQPLRESSSYSSIFPHGSTSVRPPSYAVHATQPISSSKLIAPYPSTIISTAAYLSDPLNAYAHLGMPKPFVHLIGPPLDVALDARITGDQSRFVRSGCRPNAVIRPVICHSTKKPTSNPEEMLSFGIFALRDLKPNEEVVLGWEWDDGNVVHHLPALIESPFAFPAHQIQHFRNQMTSMLHALSSTFTTCACGAKARDCALTRMAEFVENQTPLTPSPSPPSQFTKEKNAARHGGSDNRHSAEDGAAAAASSAHVDLGPLVGIERGFRTRERIPFSGGMGGVEMVPLPTPTSEAEAGPSRAQEPPTSATGRRVSFPDDLLSPPVKARRGKAKDKKGKARAEDEDVTEESDADGGRARAGSRVGNSSDPDSGANGMDIDIDVEEDAPLSEEKLPPKLRKAWIRQSAQRLQEQRRQSAGSRELGKSASDDGETEDAKMGGAHTLFDSRDMPPPPVPPSRTPPLSSVHTNHPRQHPTPSPLSASALFSGASKPPADGHASPSAPFSKLSLLSPVAPAISPVSASSPHPPAQTQEEAPAPAPPPPARKRKTTNSSQAGEGKEAPKKAKPKARKEKAAKDKDKDKEKDAPQRTLKEKEHEDAALLKPSLVRKGGAKRKQSTSSASVSPRVPPRDVISSPTLSSRAPSVLASPAATSAPLPPPSVSPVAPSAPLLPPPASPSAHASTVSSDAPITSDSPEEIKETSVQADTATKVEDVEMRDAPPEPTPAPLVVVDDPDVKMVDEEPTGASVPLPPPPRAASPARPATPAPAPSAPPAPSGADLLFSLADAAVAARDMQPATIEPQPAPRPEPASTPAAPGADVQPAQEPPASEPVRPKSPTPPPPPPPPPKVKLSLKDFAERKRKQREEREKEEKERALATPTPSPVVSVPALPAEGASAPESAAAMASTAVVGEVQDATTSEQVGAAQAVPVPAVEGVHAAGEAQAVEEDRQEMAVDVQPAVSPTAEIPVRSPSPRAADEPMKIDPAMESHDVPRSPASPAPQAPTLVDSNNLDAHPAEPRAPEDISPAAKPSGKTTSRDEYAHHDDSFRTKVELLEEHVPNGLRASRPRSPPTPPRPRSSPTPPRRRASYTPPRDISPPPRERFHEPPYRRASTSSYRQDSRTPPAAPSHRDRTPPPPSYRDRTPPPLSYRDRSRPPSRRDSRTPPPLPTSPRFKDQRGPIVPQASQEDGEIFSPPPPKPPPLAPRAHTPPTQPRSFYTPVVSPPPIPARRPPSPPPVRRPLHPASYRNGGPGLGTGRPLPSAPRALRAPGGYSSHYASSGGGQNAPYYAPRGPSADRDRDRERERERDRERDRDRPPVRDWGRERGDGERAWIPGPSRGRGRGSWR